MAEVLWSATCPAEWPRTCFSTWPGHRAKIQYAVSDKTESITVARCLFTKAKTKQTKLGGRDSRSQT